MTTREERGSMVCDLPTLQKIQKAGFCTFHELTGKPYGYTSGIMNHVQTVSDGIFEVKGRKYYGKELGGWKRIFKVV
jgi:hypothetical protein